jgi:hypothetical protein
MLQILQQSNFINEQLNNTLFQKIIGIEEDLKIVKFEIRIFLIQKFMNESDDMLLRWWYVIIWKWFYRIENRYIGTYTRQCDLWLKGQFHDGFLLMTCFTEESDFLGKCKCQVNGRTCPGDYSNLGTSNRLEKQEIRSLAISQVSLWWHGR